MRRELLTRDVSEQVTWSVLGVYLAVFGVGIALTTVGGNRSRKDRYALEDEDYKDRRRKRKRKNSEFDPPLREKQTLAERLHELDDAHQQNLLSDDEYQRLRAEALEERE